MHYLSILALFFGLLVAPAWAQDPPPVEAADEAADEATDDVAPEAVPDAAPFVEEAAAAPEEAPEASEDEDKPEAPKAPETDEEAIQTALSLIDALKAGQWPLAAGLFLTLLVYLANRFAFKDAVSEKAVPWVAAGVGVAGAVGTGLVTGTPLTEALTAGVIAGVAAVGGWEMVLKHLTPKKGDAA